MDMGMQYTHEHAAWTKIKNLPKAFEDCGCNAPLIVGFAQNPLEKRKAATSSF